MNITYRNFVADDIDRIIKFWNENSGWENDMGLDEFNLRFCSSPYGEPIIMLAIDEDNNELVGQFSFLPVSVTINSRQLKSYRPFGAVFKESFREKFGIASFLTGKHPVLVLYNKGADEALRKGATLTYLLPDPRWGKILSVMPFQTKKFPLWSFNLSQEILDFDSNICVTPIDPSDPAIDQLWEKAHLVNHCAITRNCLTLQTKNKISHGKFKMTGVYQNDRLIGVFSLRYKPEGYQWMIGDLLSFDNSETLKLTLQAACLEAKKEYLQVDSEPDKSYKTAILATPLIEEIVKDIGFYKESYQFVLAVHLLDKQLSKKEVAPENWYVSDSD